MGGVAGGSGVDVESSVGEREPWMPGARGEVRNGAGGVARSVEEKQQRVLSVVGGVGESCVGRGVRDVGVVAGGVVLGSVDG